MTHNPNMHRAAAAALATKQKPKKLPLKWVRRKTRSDGNTVAGVRG